MCVHMVYDLFSHASSMDDNVFQFTISVHTEVSQQLQDRLKICTLHLSPPEGGS